MLVAFLLIDSQYFQLLLFLEGHAFLLSVSSLAAKLLPNFSDYVHFFHTFLVPPVILESCKKADFLDTLWSEVSLESLRHHCIEKHRLALGLSLSRKSSCTGIG